MMTTLKARLKNIAAYINSHCTGLEARIEQKYCNTDRHLFAHVCHPGKGRWGNCLIVLDAFQMTRTGPTVVLDHNSAETYRRNQEVEDWLRRWEMDHPERKR